MIEVPMKGGSGLTPTGPLKFSDDWPGYWIRGDQFGEIRMALEYLRSKGVKLPPALESLRKADVPVISESEK